MAAFTLFFSGGVAWKMYHRSWKAQLDDLNNKWDESKPWETYPSK